MTRPAVVHLGRAPAAIDDNVLDAWQSDDEARQSARHAELAPPAAAP